MKSLVIFFLFMLNMQFVSAAVKVGYTRITPLESDPGNEITQDDFIFDFSKPVYQSDDHLQVYGTGLSFQSTVLKFDDARIGDVRLLKVMFPVTGTHIRSAETIISWAVSPGLHGEHGSMSDAEFRAQGQLTFVLPRPDKQWILGAVYGEQFGKPQLAPVLGVVWKLSERSQLSTLFPLLKYEYSADEKTKYNVAIQPVGAQWTWQRGDVGNQEAGNIELSAIQFSGGAQVQFSEKYSGNFALGLLTNRKIKISRQSDSSINASVDLKNAWMAQAGLDFP